MCVTSYNVLSNVIKMEVKPSGKLNAEIRADKADACMGASVQFDVIG
jgi:hypothetical protein